MRVLIVTRPLFGLPSATAARAVAEELPATVAWLPVVERESFGPVIEELHPGAVWLAPEELVAVAQAGELPEQIFVDCRDFGTTAGRELLAGLGGLAAGRDLLSGTHLIGIVAESESETPVLGVTGLASTTGFAANWDRGRVLAEDEMLAGWLAEIGIADRPGLGAGGGVAAALLALGGENWTAPAWCASAAGAAKLWNQAEVVLVLAERFDVGFHGGEAVSWVRQQAHVPVLVAAVGAEMSRREARALGIEEVWGIPTPDAAGLAALGRSLAKAWIGPQIT